MLQIAFNKLKGAFILQIRKCTSVEVGKWSAKIGQPTQMDVSMVLKTCKGNSKIWCLKQVKAIQKYGA